MAKQNLNFGLSLLLVLFLSVLLISCNNGCSSSSSSNGDSNGGDGSTPAVDPPLTIKIESNSVTFKSFGSVTSKFPGINCGSDCTESYAQGTSVQLTAKAKSYHKFTGWSDDCSGSENPLTVIMDKAKTCSARFIRIKLTDTGQTTGSSATFGEDSDYTIDTPSSTNSGKTVTDNKTGLVWQRDGQDKCNKSKNSEKCTWEEAKTHCDGLQLAEKNDWRLPSFDELLGIVNYDNSNLAIDEKYFSATAKSMYWSSTSSEDEKVWGVRFWGSSAPSQISKTTPYNIRCVRGEPLPSADFKDNEDGTVTDRSTGLTWQQKGDTELIWKEALIYCEKEMNEKGQPLGGFTDWRLPNIKELSSIVDRSKSKFIYSTHFPGSSSSSYWSSTIDAGDTSYAWGVNFGYGDVGGGNRSYRHYVRCVRGG